MPVCPSRPSTRLMSGCSPGAVTLTATVARDPPELVVNVNTPVAKSENVKRPAASVAVSRDTVEFFAVRITCAFPTALPLLSRTIPCRIAAWGLFCATSCAGATGASKSIPARLHGNTNVIPRNNRVAIVLRNPRRPLIDKSETINLQPPPAYLGHTRRNNLPRSQRPSACRDCQTDCTTAAKSRNNFPREKEGMTAHLLSRALESDSTERPTTKLPRPFPSLLSQEQMRNQELRSARVVRHVLRLVFRV